MNNLVTNFSQIMELAVAAKLPIHRPRAIIREYLQSLIITELYSHKNASKFVFIGGTSLRLLRNIDRFSEDLDFDNLGLSPTEVDLMLQAIVTRLKYENIEVELITTHHQEKNYELRFPHLLNDLKISTNDKEKLKIKIDYTSFWHGHHPETILFSRYGFIERVVTNPINHMLVQKLSAYVGRNQPRDMYDVVWMYSQGARLDHNFMAVNHLENLLDEARTKSRSTPVTNAFRRRLQPFLFSDSSLTKLDLFPDVLEKLG